jgi:hypothetical protein
MHAHPRRLGDRADREPGLRMTHVSNHSLT